MTATLPINDEDLKDQSSITNFYKNKSVFITGGSGFVGKALIEKLLRSCFGLNKIYLLLRHKKGKPGSHRLDEIFNCKVELKYNFFIHKILKYNSLNLV